MPLIILYRKSAILDKNGKYTKHTRHIFRRTYFVINGEEFNFIKKEWYEENMKLSCIGTNNVREDKLNPRLEYTMVILEN